VRIGITTISISSACRALPGSACGGTRTIAPPFGVQTATAASQIGGCDFPVDPKLDASNAPVFWNPEDAPAVTQYIGALPTSGSTSAPVRPSFTAQGRDDSGLIWTRLDDGAVLVGAVADLTHQPLGILLPLDDDWPIRIAAADNLRRALIDRTADPPLSRQRRERLKRALRCVDARRAGASYRDVAAVYFGARRLSAEPWKTSSLKAQIVRLAAYGQSMIDRGYRDLLRLAPRRR